jgi:hypothetical protein
MDAVWHRGAKAGYDVLFGPWNYGKPVFMVKLVTSLHGCPGEIEFVGAPRDGIGEGLHRDAANGGRTMMARWVSKEG